MLVFIVTGAFWKLLTKQYTWLDHPDMANQVLPWLQFQATAWKRGEWFPLWDPHVWGGQPLVGQLQPGAAYPFNWILFLLPFRDGHIDPMWLHLYFIVDHVLAALFCYWLCRDLRRSRFASVLAGSIFALTGVVGALGWPQMLHGAIWIPLVLLFFFRSERGERPVANAALSGAFLGLSLLSGHHQIPTFTCLLLGILWLVRLRRALAPAATFGTCAFLVSALQILPAHEYGRHAVRFVGTRNGVYWGQSVPYQIHQDLEHSLFPSGLLGLVIPNAGSHDAFVGLAALALALLGFAACFRKPEVQRMGAIALGALVFALGGFSLFHGVAYLLVPMVEKARTPAMALVLAQLAIAILAAFGLDACRTRAWSRWWIPGLAVAGLLPWLALPVLTVVRAQTELEYERLAVFGLVALALAAILYGWRRRNVSRAAAMSFVLLLALFETGSVTGRNFQTRGRTGSFLRAPEQNRDIVEFLRREGASETRLEVDTDAVPYNIGDWDEFDQFQGYLGGLTSNLIPFGAENPATAVISPKLFALGFYLGKTPARPSQQEVFRGQSGVNVYRNPEAFPRLWTVHGSGPLDALRISNLRETVALAGELPALETCAAREDKVRWLQRRSGRLEVEAAMACTGMVVLSETYFPGWEAKVDGKPARIYEAYGVLRGVIAPGGVHRIAMEYRPKSVFIGGLLTALGLAGALAAVYSLRLAR